MSALFRICRIANLAALQDQLRRGADPFQRDDKGRTLLHAVALGNTWKGEKHLVQTGEEGTIEGAAVFSGLVLFLLIYRVKINKRDKYGRTALHIAAYQGTESFYRMLTSRGAKSSLIDGYGRNMLHYAVFNKVETLQACLDNMKRPHVALSSIDKQGMTPVGYCCLRGNNDVLKVIWPIYIESVTSTQRRTHVNRKDSRSRTFLHLAVISKNPDCVKLLRKSEIDVFAVDVTGRTALHYIAIGERGNSSGTFLDLFQALTRDLTDAELERLVNYPDAEQRTALHYAILQRNSEVVRSILAGPDDKPPNSTRKTGAKLLTDKKGYTPFHLALSVRDGDACRLLIDRIDVAELIKPDQNRRSLLHWLVAHGDHHTNPIWDIDYFWKLPQVAALLADKSLLFDKTNLSPVHMAAEKGNVDAVTSLIKHIPDIANLNDNKNRTPLHLACQYGQIEVVNELYRAGVDVNAKDINGRTSLMYAAGTSNFDVVVNLIQHNASTKELDNNGWSAAEHAASKNSRQALAVFVGKKIIDLQTCESLLTKYKQSPEALEMVKKYLETYPDIDDIVLSLAVDSESDSDSDERPNGRNPSDSDSDEGPRRNPSEEGSDDDNDMIVHEDPKPKKKPKAGVKSKHSDSDSDEEVLDYGDMVVRSDSGGRDSNPKIDTTAKPPEKTNYLNPTSQLPDGGGLEIEDEDFDDEVKGAPSKAPKPNPQVSKPTDSPPQITSPQNTSPKSASPENQDLSGGDAPLKPNVTMTARPAGQGLIKPENMAALLKPNGTTPAGQGAWVDPTDSDDDDSWATAPEEKPQPEPTPEPKPEPKEQPKKQPEVEKPKDQPKAQRTAEQPKDQPKTVTKPSAAVDQTAEDDRLRRKLEEAAQKPQVPVTTDVRAQLHFDESGGSRRSSLPPIKSDEELIRGVRSGDADNEIHQKRQVILQTEQELKANEEVLKKLQEPLQKMSQKLPVEEEQLKVSEMLRRSAIEQASQQLKLEALRQELADKQALLVQRRALRDERRKTLTALAPNQNSIVERYRERLLTEAFSNGTPARSHFNTLVFLVIALVELAVVLVLILDGGRPRLQVAGF